MDTQTIAEGIRQFAGDRGGSFSQVDDMLFRVTFPDEGNATLIGTDVLGMTMSYTTYLWVLTTPSVAATLLQKNWGGIDGTCFYLSVHVYEGKAWLVLETKQILDSCERPQDIASLLGLCRLQWSQANEFLVKAFGAS